MRLESSIALFALSQYVNIECIKKWSEYFLTLYKFTKSYERVSPLKSNSHLDTNSLLLWKTSTNILWFGAKLMTGEECSGGICTRAPYAGKTSLPERHDVGHEAVAGAGWLVLHFSPGLAFDLRTPQGTVQLGWVRMGRCLRWESLNFLWCYLHIRFMGTFM